MENNYEEFLPKDNSWQIKRDNGMVLSDYQIEVLRRNGINYELYGSLKEILFEINDILDEEDDEELETVARELAEKDYYSNDQ